MYIYIYYFLTITGGVYFLYHHPLSVTKRHLLYKDLRWYGVSLIFSLAIVMMLLNIETELNFNASFKMTGEIIIDTKSNKQIENIVFQVYSGDGEYKLVEKKIETYKQSGYYTIDKLEKTNINQESRQYRISLMNFKEKLSMKKNYFAEVIVSIDEERYRLENEFFLEKNQAYFKEKNMSYKYEK